MKKNARNRPAPVWWLWLIRKALYCHEKNIRSFAQGFGHLTDSCRRLLASGWNRA
jgi:hypothetical protein